MTASASGTLGHARDKLAGVLLIALSASAFGAMAIFARFAYAAGADVYGLLAVRFLLAAIAMGFVMRARGSACRRGVACWRWRRWAASVMSASRTAFSRR
jgi:hypothetical protein